MGACQDATEHAGSAAATHMTTSWRYGGVECPHRVQSSRHRECTWPKSRAGCHSAAVTSAGPPQRKLSGHIGAAAFRVEDAWTEAECIWSGGASLRCTPQLPGSAVAAEASCAFEKTGRAAVEGRANASLPAPDLGSAAGGVEARIVPAQRAVARSDVAPLEDPMRSVLHSWRCRASTVCRADTAPAACLRCRTCALAVAHSPPDIAIVSLLPMGARASPRRSPRPDCHSTMSCRSGACGHPWEAGWRISPLPPTACRCRCSLCSNCSRIAVTHSPACSMIL